MKTDQVFKAPINRSTDFKFDAQVANVFNDMVSRSVPYYLEMQRMIANSGECEHPIPIESEQSIPV